MVLWFLFIIIELLFFSSNQFPKVRFFFVFCYMFYETKIRQNVDAMFEFYEKNVCFSTKKLNIT